MFSLDGQDHWLPSKALVVLTSMTDCPLSQYYPWSCTITTKLPSQVVMSCQGTVPHRPTSYEERYHSHRRCEIRS